MPISKRWSKFNASKIADAPDTIGWYELADNSGHVLYIGEGNIRSRLEEALSGGSSPKPGTGQFRYKETNSKRRAEQREREELKQFKEKHGKLPRYNDRDEVG